MKTRTHLQSISSKRLPTKLGPGEYRPAGIFQTVEDLPKPKIIKQQRDTSTQPCPQCGRPASRHRSYNRRLHDLGDLLSGRPCILEVTYSQHYCSACQKYFNLDLSDLAAPKSLYTHRVQDLAVRLVVEDGLPYRTASWHLWRDPRVFVPFATLQNWVEAGGKKASERMATDYLDWALAHFSGYIAADELYDGPFCVLTIVDNRTYKRLCYRVLGPGLMRRWLSANFDDTRRRLGIQGLNLISR